MIVNAKYRYIWVVPLDREWIQANIHSMIIWCGETFGSNERWIHERGLFYFINMADLAMFVVFVSGLQVPNSAFHYDRKQNLNFS